MLRASRWFLVRILYQQTTRYTTPNWKPEPEGDPLVRGKAALENAYG